MGMNMTPVILGVTLRKKSLAFLGFGLCGLLNKLSHDICAQTEQGMC